MENKHWVSLSAPISIIVIACSIALFMGVDPNRVLLCGLVSIPIVGYVGFSVWTVLFAMKVGEIGASREMTLQGKFYFWHGISVVLAGILSAVGSFLIMFFLQVGRLFGA